jgi:hypothetical protein
LRPVAPHQQEVHALGMQQDNACPILYAHTRRDRREAKWVRLNAHLEDVAARAAGFARKFGAEDLARAVCLLHDVGKQSQRPLPSLSAGRRCEHRPFDRWRATRGPVLPPRVGQDQGLLGGWNAGGDQVAGGGKGVGEGSIHSKKALGRTAGAGALHSSLKSPYWEVRTYRPIVLAFAPGVLRGEPSSRTAAP